MKDIHTHITVLIALIMAAPIASPAEESDAITIGKRRALHSKILDENRPLNVYLPNSYGSGDERYPVLYLLDGPFHFHHTTGLVQFLAGNRRIPEMIVIAVGNTDRTRDLTPSAGKMGSKEVGGGANAFLQFLTDELSPWIDEEYRTRPYRLLVGHSFGGLFGIHALITRPDFFQGIIAISPSMQWDDQHTVDEVEEWLGTDPTANASIYMTVGNEGIGLLGGTMKVAGLFSSNLPSGLRWQFKHMPDESHGSVPHRSTYDGLEFIFSDWQMPDILAAYDAGGWANIEAFYARNRARYGFEAKTPATAVQKLLRAFVSAKRIPDALDFLESKDKQALPAPAQFFIFAASQLEEEDRVNRERCYRLCLQRFPSNKTAHEALVKMGVEVPELVTGANKVEVPLEVLESYVGRYDFEAAGSPIAVSVTEEALMIQMPGKEAPETAYSITQSQFSVGDDGLEVTFREEEGTIISLIVTFGDQQFSCPKEK